MAAQQHGLSTPADIEALADQLSICADELHASVVRAVKSKNGSPISEADQTAARALFDEELLLRQRANALYADSATLVVKSLSASQQHIVDITAAAAEKIRKITLISDAAALVAGLVGLAGAAASGNASLIVKALEAVHKHAKAVGVDLDAAKAAKAAKDAKAAKNAKAPALAQAKADPAPPAKADAAPDKHAKSRQAAAPSGKPPAKPSTPS